jgi:hypothetical protein
MACAGAETQDVLQPLPDSSAQSDGVTKGKADPTTTSDGNDPAPPNAPPAAGTNVPGNTSGGGSDPSGPGGGGGECTAEVESNDSLDEATPFTSCVTGSISNNQDTDYLRVVAPDNAHKMSINHQENGRVSYQVGQEKDGALMYEVDPFGPDANMIRVFPGAELVFHVSGAGWSKSERQYTLNVTFE